MEYIYRMLTACGFFHDIDPQIARKMSRRATFRCSIINDKDLIDYQENIKKEQNPSLGRRFTIYDTDSSSDYSDEYYPHIEEEDNGSIKLEEGQPSIEISFDYKENKDKLTIKVGKVVNVQCEESVSELQVHLIFFSTTSNAKRTKYKPIDDANFQEHFKFKFQIKDIIQCDLYIKLYGRQDLKINEFKLFGINSLKRSRLLGDNMLQLSDFNLEGKATYTVPLRLSSAMSELVLPVFGLRIPQVRIDLLYKEKLKQLFLTVVEVVNLLDPWTTITRKGQYFFQLTYISSDGQMLLKKKTTTRPRSRNVIYNEHISFDIALSKVPHLTIVVSLHKRKKMKRTQLVAACSLGFLNTNEEDFQHWNDMYTNPGEVVSRWHELCNCQD